MIQTDDNEFNDANFGPFPKLALRYIAPCLSLLNFRITEVQRDRLNFASPSLKATITYERFSCEIRFMYSRNIDSRAFSLKDLLDFKLGVNKYSCSIFQACDWSDVAVCLRGIGLVIQQYGQEILSGDIDQYEKLAMFVHSRDENFTNVIIDGSLRAAVIAAWERHDFNEVVNLYGRFKSTLTELERRRLLYAKNKVKDWPR